MVKKTICILTLLLVSLVTGVPGGFAASQMPSFSLEDVVNGGKINSSSFEGKALLITFFATTCPPCVEEVPSLIKLHKKYSLDGFSVVAIAVNQGPVKPLKDFVDKKSIIYPVALADKQVIKDFGGVYGIPLSFLINRKGRVVKRYMGYQSLSVLEKDLQRVL